MAGHRSVDLRAGGRTVAGARTPEQLQTSILDPDAEILPADRIIRVVSKNNLLKLRTPLVQMIDKAERGGADAAQSPSVPLPGFGSLIS